MTTTIDPRASASPNAQKPASAVAGAPSTAARTDDIVIGMGVTSSGRFSTAGLICVDGILTDADVEASVLSISRGGEFYGTAKVERIEIFGTLCGDVVASEQIVLRASAVVTGKICAPYIITHRGAAVSGEVKSLERRPEVQLPPALQQRTGMKGLRRPGIPLLVGVALVVGLGSGLAIKRWTDKPVAEPAIVADAAQHAGQ